MGASQVRVTVPPRATAPLSGFTTKWTSSRGTGSGAGKGHEVENYTCVWSQGQRFQIVLTRAGGPPHLCLPQTLSWMGAVCRARRRGRPGLKLQEKVGWGAPPRIGVTISSDWSVKSPVSGCLLVSSFTDTPVVGEEGKISQGLGGEGSKRRHLQWEEEGLGLTFAIRYQGFPIQVPAKSPCRIAPLRHTCPHLGERVTSSSLKIRDSRHI